MSSSFSAWGAVTASPATFSHGVSPSVLDEQQNAFAIGLASEYFVSRVSSVHSAAILAYIDALAASAPSLLVAASMPSSVVFVVPESLSSGATFLPHATYVDELHRLNSSCCFNASASYSSASIDPAIS